MIGRARIRFDVRISHADGGAEIVRGYTTHVFADVKGKPIRPPAALVDALGGATPAP
jgi:acyl-CoA thioesterase FadM